MKQRLSAAFLSYLESLLRDPEWPDLRYYYQQMVDDGLGLAWRDAVARTLMTGQPHSIEYGCGPRYRSCETKDGSISTFLLHPFLMRSEPVWECEPDQTP